MSGKKLLNPILLKRATALPESYGSWVSSPIDCEGLAVLGLMLTASGPTVASVKLKVQASADLEHWRDVGKSDAGEVSGVDELTIAAANLGLLVLVQCHYSRWLRFQAIRDGGEAASALELTVVGGQP